MNRFFNTLCTLMLVTVLATVSTGLWAQTTTFYVCAGHNFKLVSTSGFDEYEWTEDGTVIAGADSNKLAVAGFDPESVGNASVLKTYTIKVRRADGCWSDESTFVVNILPQLSVDADGFTPPYCENHVEDVNLTASINGATGTSALTLPEGMGVAYEWTVEAGAEGNAAITAGENTAIATVKTSSGTDIDNAYKVTVRYTYPDDVDVATRVVGDCSDAHIATIHAEPAPPTPSIHYMHL